MPEERDELWNRARPFAVRSAISTMLLRLPLLLLSVPAALSFGVGLSTRHTGSPSLSRARAVRLGFEVEDVDDDAVAELGVFSWPGLEKRTSEFTQSATAEELLMVFVQSGSATLTDAEETVDVKEGQMVMVSDGEVKWSGLPEGGLTLISSTAEMKDAQYDEDEAEELEAAIKAADEPVEDLSIKEAAILLGAGLLAGGLASFGLKIFNGGG